MKIDEITQISIDEYDGPSDDRGLDFSILNSINTCPFYGIIRHIHNKTFAVNERNMALECGDLCHKCFAVYRALSICDRGIAEENSIIYKIGLREIKKVFMEVMPDATLEIIDYSIDECFERAKEFTTRLAKYTVFSDFIIDNSAYYDDPNDKKRTIANIKDSLTHYCSNFLNIVDNEPVWIKDINDENSKVGIECEFNTNLKIKFIYNGEEHEQLIHFIGKIDGIHYRKDDNNSIIIHENKTASRLDDSWLGQWYKSHQITGYCMLGNYITDQLCLQARILGMQIPAPKTSGYAFRMERVDRENFNFADWTRWIILNNAMIEDYKDIPQNAPMNTHACCKYYKQCSFVPLCCSDPEERLRIIEEDMITDEWNPLEGD